MNTHRYYYMPVFVLMTLLFGCAPISKNLLVTPYVINQREVDGIQQAYTVGGRGADWGSSVLCSRDGSGCTLFGYSIKSFGNSTDMLAVKLSPSWKPIWAKAYGGTNKETFYAAINTRDGGYLMLGDTLSLFNTPLRVLSPHYKSPRPLLVKIDNAGNVQWARTLYCNLRSIYETVDGSFLAVGDFYRQQRYAGKFKTHKYKSDVILVKLDKEGRVKWSKTYASGDSNAHASTVRESHDGGIMIGGTIQMSGADNDVFLVKLTADGALVWSKMYEYEKHQGFNDILETEDHGWLLMGPHTDGDTTCAILLVKVSPAGDVLWSNLYSSTEQFDRGSTMIRGYNNSYLIVGRSDNVETRRKSDENAKGAFLLVNEKGHIITSAQIALPTVLMSAAMAGKGEYVVVGSYIKSDRWKYGMFTASWRPQMKGKSRSSFSAIPITLSAKTVTTLVAAESAEDDFIVNLDVIELNVKPDEVDK
jgi:hypothetical protein